MNKEVNKQEEPTFVSAFTGRSTAVRYLCPQPVPELPGLQAPKGITGIPLTRNWVLETMTLSPAFSPEEME